MDASLKQHCDSNNASSAEVIGLTSSFFGGHAWVMAITGVYMGRS
jgi:hypothetical protein